MTNEVSAQTLDLIKSSHQSPTDLAKSWTQPGSAITGINAYDLSKPAKKLYPVNTPIRNMLPRDATGVGTATNWRSITGINTTNLASGVAERNRGGVITTSVVSKTAPFFGLGLEDYVTYEADYAAKSFDDVKALAVQGLLESLMISEEKYILGGNNSIALGTTGTPTLADITTGGSLLANTTYRVICVALTHEGFMSSSVANGVVGQVVRTNADGTTTTYGGGSAQQSTAATVTTANDSNNTHKVSATVTLIPGAVAYAWYLGTTSGTEKLAAITTINSVVLSAINSSGQLASAIVNAGADNSQNAYVFDGFFSQIVTSNSGGYTASLATGTAGTGTPLSANGSVGITQIDTALKAFWDNYQLAPTHMFVNAQELKNISAKILQSGSSGAYRINAMAADKNGAIVGNALVSQYLNQFGYAGNQVIDIVLHPYMPPGTILFYTKKLPYQLSNVEAPVKMKLRQDYYEIEWPRTKRSFDYGIYMDGVLQNFFVPACGMITNIADG